MKKTREIRIGKVYIGAKHPIAIQSMAKTKTADVAQTLRQIIELESAGCEIVRVAVKDQDDAQAIAALKPRIKIPLVADIHFDWRLALAAIASGADKIRLNPGNIYKREQVREICQAAKSAGIPIRVGLNSGSIGKTKDQVAGMVKLCRQYIKMLEGFAFHDIVISLKCQNVRDTIRAYRQIARAYRYPLHLGVTATGAPFSGLVKSSMAIGALLLEGIGDTIRVSLTADPVEEIKASQNILEALGLRRFGPEIISCPTCGRCEVDLVRIVTDLEGKLLAKSKKLRAKPVKIAVMGCVVNGPGEAKLADIGIAFGKKEGLLFKKGKPVRKVSADKCVETLIKELGNL